MRSSIFDAHEHSAPMSLGIYGLYIVLDYIFDK